MQRILECHQDTFFDVRVFNPLASSNRNTTIPALFKANEHTKRRSYEQRVIEVEHGSFTPLVFAATGGMGPAATITLWPSLTSPYPPGRLEQLLMRPNGGQCRNTLIWIPPIALDPLQLKHWECLVNTERP